MGIGLKAKEVLSANILKFCYEWLLELLAASFSLDLMSPFLKSEKTCTGLHFRAHKYIVQKLNLWGSSHDAKLTSAKQQTQWIRVAQRTYDGTVCPPPTIGRRRNYFPPPLYWISAVKCKLQPLRKRRQRRRWRMAPEAPEQPMNLWLMSRLISRRATSTLAINLRPPPSPPYPPPPSPPPLSVDIWLTHQQTQPRQWMEAGHCERSALAAEAGLHFSGGLKTRQLAGSQLPP